MQPRPCRAPEHFWLLHDPALIAERIAETILAPAPLCTHATRAQKVTRYANAVNTRFRSARHRSDFETALRDAHACQMTAGHGSKGYAWAFYMIAGLSLNVGQHAHTLTYGRRFLQLAPEFPDLAPYIPKMIRSIALVYYYRRQYQPAVDLLRKANSAFLAQGNREESLRASALLVWALTMMGRLNEARRVLPRTAPPHLTHLQQGARCVLLLAEQKFEEAVAAGQAALAAPRPLYDSLDGAEVAEILARIAARRGLKSLSRTLRQQASAMAALQGDQKPELHWVPMLVFPIIPSWIVAPSLVSGERSGASFTTGVA